MSLGSHQQTVGKSQSHLTPPHIIEALGPFDLDPCAAICMPWDTATWHYTICENGLVQPWRGFVWCNPPFDRYQVGLWAEKMAAHNNGIMLLHARTETEWFSSCWMKSSGILFLDHRLHFHREDGTRQPANSGAPVCLVAFGHLAEFRIKMSGISGYWVNSVSRLERKVS
jgi:hypothetical protein